MLKRWITDKLEDNIKHTPAVALLGARQVGKTTLAKGVTKKQKSIYLDLESPEDLFKLSDPVGFLSQQNDKIVILDEIQRVPNLFKVLRGLIDKNREKGRKGAQFLLLGSASMDLLRQSSESLAGRISYIEMYVLNVLEIQNKQEEIKKLWLRGGFPDSYLAESDKRSMDWLENMIRTYLERDVPQAGFRVPAVRLRRLWTMLAHLQGETINYSKLGGNLEVDSKTISHYIDILVDLLLVRRLEPWHNNVKKRLVKSPRFYIRDSGIVHRLLGISDYNDLLSNPVIGKSWEGFVIENIHSVLPNSAQTYFYRTSAGAEIDLVIKLSSKEVWAVEIKNGMAPQITKGFHQAAQDIKASKKYVVYGGNDKFPIGNDTTVISLTKLLKKLEKFEK
ncbi:ATP-binding protein [Pseudomonadota bacterium]